jgi:predicted phage terminase large subunit-like protein
MTSDKYKRIFPGSALKPGRSTGVLQPTRNSTTIEIGNGHLGSFFNTTTGGAVTGETLKLGVIDDPVKGREAANSPTIRDKTWDWFESDFFSRFDEYGGLLMIMTRWHVDDLAARIIERIEGTKVINYPAIATEDEQYRNKGMALFPEHKSLKFLNIRKNFMLPAHWEGLYQQRPTSMDGGIILASWWNWYTTLPRLKYRFLTADTAQKVKTTHDYSVFQAWGVDSNKNLFLLDQLRAKLTAPDLRATAEQFYKKHAITKKRADDPSFKGIYIEDKSSGTGLVQELKAIGLRVTEVPRYTDKATRAEDAAITISQGKVFLSKAVQGSDIIVKEASQIPDGANDDCIDATMTAIEHVHGKKTTSLYDLIASGRD